MKIFVSIILIVILKVWLFPAGMFKIYGGIKGRANLNAKMLPCEVKYHKAGWSFLLLHSFTFKIYVLFSLSSYTLSSEHKSVLCQCNLVLLTNTRVLPLLTIYPLDIIFMVRHNLKWPIRISNKGAFIRLCLEFTNKFSWLSYLTHKKTQNKTTTWKSHSLHICATPVKTELYWAFFLLSSLQVHCYFN